MLHHRYSSVRNSHITEGIKKMISTRQEEVKGAITATDKQLIVLENKLEELNLSNDDEDIAGSEAGKTETVRQLEEERKALESSRTLLDELFSRAQEEAIIKAAVKSQSSSTTVSMVTFGDHNSGQQAGVIHGGVHGAVFGGR
jgi:hypothetical protein